MYNINEKIILEKESGNSIGVYLLFQIREQHYGIPIDNVIEIVQFQELTNLPGLPPYAKGIFNLRGRIIPLIDLNLLLNSPPSEYGDRTGIVIINYDELFIGIAVDDVEDVTSIGNELASPPPFFSKSDTPGYVEAVVRTGDNITLLLDVPMLLSDDNFQ